MRDYQKELDALREQIAQRREDMRLLEQLCRQEKQCEQEVASRMTQWSKEERDVEKLEKFTLSAVWAALRGNKDEELDREKAEAYAARLRLQEAERQRDEIRYEIRMRQDRIKASETCEQRYETVLREKAEDVRKTNPILAEKLSELEQRELGLTSRRKELQEALAAGRQTLDHVRSVIVDLDDAEGWSTWDILGGGLIADAMKYSSMDEAQKKIEWVQSDLRRYEAELADVAQTAVFDLQPDGFLQFADFFWDNIFADFAVRDHIYQSQDRMQGLKHQVERIQTGLEQELDEAERGLTVQFSGQTITAERYLFVGDVPTTDEHGQARNCGIDSPLAFNLSPLTSHLSPSTSISYFSQRYFTTCGGRILVLGVMWLARRKAASVRSQRRNVSPLTPAARASSILVYDFISSRTRCYFF